MSRLKRIDVLNALGSQELYIRELVDLIPTHDHDEISSVLLPLIASGEIEFTVDRKLRLKTDE